MQGAYNLSGPCYENGTTAVPKACEPVRRGMCGRELAARCEQQSPHLRGAGQRVLPLPRGLWVMTWPAMLLRLAPWPIGSSGTKEQFYRSNPITSTLLRGRTYAVKPFPATHFCPRASPSFSLAVTWSTSR